MKLLWVSRTRLELAATPFFLVAILAGLAGVGAAQTSGTPTAPQSSGGATSQPPATPPRTRGHREPTHADILRGAYGPYRANNDLLFYHLDIRVDPEKKF